MNEKDKIKLIIIFSVILLLLTAVAVFIQNSKQKKEDQRIKSELSLSQSLEDAVGGVIVENGFEINYLPEEKELFIKITEEPFKTYKGKAINYLSDRGIDLCSANYYIQAARGIENPEPENSNGASCKEID